MLPLTLPPDGSMDGIFRISNQRAKAAGLRNRSLEETAAGTLAWDQAEGQPEIPGVPTEDEEAKLLAAGA